MPKKSPKYSGYIEGYYGRLLNWEDRANIVSHLKKLGMNTYVYAPKEDPYHRLQWKAKYPPEWRRKFQAFLKFGKKNKVHVVPSVAPGLNFDYQSPSHYATLKQKICAFLKMGANSVALLMDDVPMTLPKNNRNYSSLGAAHADLLTKLRSDISRAFRGRGLWFCPTVYADELILKGERGYLKDLSMGIPESIPVFWTGSHVISPRVNSLVLQNALSLFGNRLLIWDNYYAHDYCPDRLFIGPFAGRSPEVLEEISGYFLNPTGLVNTDMFYLSLLKGFFQKKQEVEVWEEIVKRAQWPDVLREIRPLVDGPFAKIDKLTEDQKKALRAHLRYLIFEWDSSWRTEWFTAFQILLRDLALSMESRSVARLRRYTPVLREFLEGKL